MSLRILEGETIFEDGPIFNGGPIFKIRVVLFSSSSFLKHSSLFNGLPDLRNVVKTLMR